MPQFGKSSREKLNTCHPLIQELMERVVKEYDCTVLEGARTIGRQQMLVAQGKSKTMKSKHIPKGQYSYAIDVVPYPIAWGEDEEKAIRAAFDSRDGENLKELIMEYREVIARFYHFAGFVQGVALEMGLNIRWGGDWDGDNDFSDQTFHDLPHFEMIESE